MNTQLNKLQRLLLEIDSIMGSVEVSGLIRDARSGAVKARSAAAKAIKITDALAAMQPSPAEQVPEKWRSAVQDLCNALLSEGAGANGRKAVEAALTMLADAPTQGGEHA